MINTLITSVLNRIVLANNSWFRTSVIAEFIVHRIERHPWILPANTLPLSPSLPKQHVFLFPGCVPQSKGKIRAKVSHLS